MTDWTEQGLDPGSVTPRRCGSRRSGRTGRCGGRRSSWLVRQGDDLYFRSVNGRGASWFRGVQDRHEGRIWAGGVEQDVRFVETDDRNDEIDTAYWAKYRHYPTIVPRIVRPEAQAATLKLMPQAPGA